MNFSTADFSINDRKKLMFSHFDHFEGKQSDFTITELYDFLDKKVASFFPINFYKNIKKRWVSPSTETLASKFLRL